MGNTQGATNPIAPSESSRRSALHLASEAGQTATVEALLADGSAVDVSDDDGTTALMLACINGHSSVVRLLLGTGTSALDAADRGGFTPLALASEYGWPNICEMLLAAGADANATAVDGTTPLYVACQEGGDEAHVACVRLLLGAGACLTGSEGADSCTPLHAAAETGSADCLRLLLEAGAPVDAVNDDGLTPLHLCEAQRGCILHRACADALLEAGATRTARPDESEQASRRLRHDERERDDRICGRSRSRSPDGRDRRSRSRSPEGRRTGTPRTKGGRDDLHQDHDDNGFLGARI
jgi:ankyrin repeat protein